jgi:hypothetical protein
MPGQYHDQQAASSALVITTVTAGCVVLPHITERVPVSTVAVPRLPCHDVQDAVKVMAKSLIRNRHAVTKLHGLKSQLQAVSLRIQVGVFPLHAQPASMERPGLEHHQQQSSGSTS